MIIRVTSRREKYIDKRLAFVISWMVLGLFLVNAGSVLMPIIGDVAELLSTINKVIIIILIAFNFGLILSRIRVDLILMILTLALAIIVSLIVSNESTGYLHETLDTFFLTVVPIIIVAGCIVDYSVVVEQLIIISSVIILLSVPVLVLAVLFVDYSYYMGYANSLTLPVIMMLYFWSKEHVKWSLCFALGGIVSILILGSRGALLGIVIYWLILLFEKAYFERKKGYILFLIPFLFLVILNVEKILLWINNIFSSLGITSRTITLVLSYSDSNSRNVLYERIWNEILENPFAIRGIAGEYSSSGGLYAHNFVLELLCQFGIVVGGLGLIIIAVYIARNIFFMKVSIERNLLIITLSASLPVLFVSGSIWMHVYFWIWITLNVKSRQCYRKNNNENIASNGDKLSEK